MGKRGWAILIAVVAVVAIAALSVWALAGRPTEPAARANPSPTSTTTATPVTSPTAISTSTPEAIVGATCETISTPEFRAAMADNGWIAWETQDEQIGARPFDRFPGGAPAGQIVCRWGDAPDLATDNVIDLAWSPIRPDAAADAQDLLVAEGYERIDAPEGVYLAMPGVEGWSDAEGYADTYLFTVDDVRWSITKEYVAFVTAPDEQG